MLRPRPLSAMTPFDIQCLKSFNFSKYNERELAPITQTMQKGSKQLYLNSKNLKLSRGTRVEFVELVIKVRAHVSVFDSPLLPISNQNDLVHALTNPAVKFTTVSCSAERGLI